MNINRKKIIIIVFTIVILVGAGLFVYYRYFNKKPLSIINAPKQDAKISKISEQKMYFPFLSENGEAIYYLKKDNNNGNLYQYSLKSGQDTILFNPILENPFDVTWSSNSAIVKTDKFGQAKKILNSSGISNYLINFRNQSRKEIDSYIGEVSFSPDGRRIIYQYIDLKNEINTINISDSDGKNWTKISDGTTDDYNFIWANQDIILMLEIPTDIGGAKLYSYSVRDKNLNPINSEERYSAILYNPRKNLIIYEYLNNNKPYLGVMNLDGSSKKDLGVGTHIRKATLLPSGEEIVAAIDDFANKKDKFYKININSLEKTELDFQQSYKFDVSGLFSSSDGKNIFVSSNDNFLYKLEL